MSRIDRNAAAGAARPPDQTGGGRGSAGAGVRSGLASLTTAMPTEWGSGARFAAAMLGWLAVAGLLTQLDPHFRAVATHDTAWRGTLLHLIVPALAGFLWQSTVRSPAWVQQVAAAGLLFGLWLAVSAILQLPLPGRAGASAWPTLAVALQLLALGAGLLAGWATPTALATHLDRVFAGLERMAFVLVAIFTAAALVVSIPPEAVLIGSPTAARIAGPSALPGSVAGHAYALLKSIILWVPIGLLWAVAGWEHGLRRWRAAAAAAFLVAGLPLLIVGLRAQDLFEVLGGYWGTGFGIWLGVATRAMRSPSAPAIRESAPPVVQPSTSGSAAVGQARAPMLAKHAVPENTVPADAISRHAEHAASAGATVSPPVSTHATSAGTTLRDATPPDDATSAHLASAHAPWEQASSAHA
ncbi:MAG: hypothetical protein ABI920_18135, partial [Casimicrobiaceae bacterium]